MEAKQVRKGVWEIPIEGNMRVPGRVFATEKVFRGIEEGALQQIKNVATLPGIIDASIGMPDAHWGYGFAIGGVAAFGREDGVVSPGGVGFDINCGVRLIKTNLTEKQIQPQLPALMDALFKQVPAGVGRKGNIRLSQKELKELLVGGAAWAIEKGYGWESDLAHTEENGKMEGALPANVSQKALTRGMPQVGTLGSGNHFLEIQTVDKVIDGNAAKAFGLEKGQVTVMIHSGSRGCGHQIATDYIDVMLKAMNKYHITLPDRQLACAPIASKEAQKYIGALNCGINYAFANRQLMTHWTREAFENVLGIEAEHLGMELLYDVAHNIAKFETHKVTGKKSEVLVHRKGATRAFCAGRSEVPEAFAKTGHPALIPGSMGTNSYVVAGTANALETSWGSVAHGAGRQMSRKAAMRKKSGAEVKKELEARGKIVRANSVKGIAEEQDAAYKDVNEVVESLRTSGIANPVARMSPIAVMKG